ncbi:MAG: ribosomal RNA small subunit methyltransferase A [Acidobacteria bacterium]|nr:ribosomal RNA small subunit methyltransferase A [Acidobacteriota bacterium]
MNKPKIQNPKSKIALPFAKKSFGQNFLVDQNYIDKIIAALNPQAGETIIEIGAGRGALTEKLIASGANIIALELDRDLIPLLEKKFGACENFLLVEQDALKTDFAELANNPKFSERKPQSKLVANLPYYISTAILQKLVEQRAAFSEMILMFQREVVQRITAEAGKSERGFLTVLVEAYLKTEKLFDVPPRAFSPAPKVWSTVVRLIKKKDEELEVSNDRLFKEIISFGFSQKRKTILNNLKNLPPKILCECGGAENLLVECEINTKRRAETLTLEEWKALMNLCNPG